MIPFIDLKSQYQRIAEPLQTRLARVLEHAQFVLGPEVTELEESLAEYVGVRHCVTVASGTEALLAALMALEIRAGDEIVTTPFSFVAPAEMALLLGAKAVFVDIDPLTYNLDPRGIEKAISSRTRAIVAVGLFGQCADMDAINTVAEHHGIAVIEDAAQSLGALYKGRHSAGLSTVGCTSFFPAKPLGAYGEGGACFTDDERIAERLVSIRNHGQDRRYHHTAIGLNGRFDTLQAAVLLTKLEIFDEEIAARQRLGERYTRLIAERCPGVEPALIAPYNTSVYAQYTIQVSGRDKVRERLSERAIPTAVHYPIPLHHQPMYVAPDWALPHAEHAARRVLSLPLHPYLDNRTQEHIVTALAASCPRQMPSRRSDTPL